MSLRYKFAIAFLCSLLVVITFATISILSVQKQNSVVQFQENRNAFFSVFLDTCKISIKSHDEEQVNLIINSMIDMRKYDIVYVFLVSGYKEVSFFSDTANNDVFLARSRFVFEVQETNYLSAVGTNIYEHSAPLMWQDKYMGSLIVGFSQDYIHKQTDKDILMLAKSISVIVVVSIIFSILCIDFIANWISEPITVLMKTLDKIIESGKYIKTKIICHDEVGKLANTFNVMIDKLQEIDSLKDDFVSNVSHELRTPLSAIDGYCNLLLESNDSKLLTAQQKKGLNIIKDATQRLTGFINNILDISKIKAGKFDVEIVSIKIEETIKELVDFFRPLATIQKKKLICKIDSDVSFVQADKEKIKQIIQNLLGNAFKFTDVGAEIKIFAKTIVVDKNNYVEISISDNGIGIDKNNLNKIFDKFYQIKEGKFNRPKGTGLGLSIVYELVKIHKGTIKAESIFGKGSVFKFTLPVSATSITN
ncbi:MAG: HAMP domain-containing histidine kinase [Elusimicrobiota bacterium]|jgi:signal transduction histidine kinase|nr:HAMP domain-containing histidine kinase [Elusimicrobiota bacterium]